MSITRRWAVLGRAALLLATVVAFDCVNAAAQQLPSSTLAVKAGGEWREIWRADQAPSRWTGPHPHMTAAIRWREVARGVEQAEVSLAGDGLAWRFRVVLVRLDPARLEVSLTQALREGGTLGAWTIDTAPGEAIVALNTGQFRGGRPWGWVVRDGHEHQPPGSGALGMAFVADARGGARLVSPDSIPIVRAEGGIREAFQSYPMLLANRGSVPIQLQAPDRGVDVTHRDSRVALGQLADGRIVVALTRFDGFGGTLDGIPLGPTTPEMAAIMGALGCTSAMSLDGGLSGQLLVREGSGRALTWPGRRRVPLGLLVRARR